MRIIGVVLLVLVLVVPCLAKTPPTVPSPAAIEEEDLEATSAATESALAPEVHFSPHGGCTEAIVRLIASAKKSVLVQAYSFTSAPIAKALLEAHGRHVSVRVIVDKSQKTAKGTVAGYLLGKGVEVHVDPAHAIAHSKIMIVDDQVVETGSFNFTSAAQNSNSENAIILHDEALATIYTKNWESHLAHSPPFPASAAPK